MTATLAIDLGGSKILAALVAGAEVIARSRTETDREGGPEAWLTQIAALSAPWRGRYSAAGLSVTGRVHDGRWSAMNRKTLAVPEGFPLAARAREALGLDAALANDAQAAAWGEYRHGAGAGRDMVFLTVSTGIGGGVVLNGRLLTGRGGLAGHVGQMALDGGPVENLASGTWIASAAAAAGHPSDARAVFDAAAVGAPWAEEIVALSAARLARLCADLQCLLDPEVIVLGGGVGLAPGFLDRVTAILGQFPPPVRPTLARAALGPEAGIIGMAALATELKTGSD
ncbi:ROK family protein [Histidinibacterium lentulum]|uniref:ROK family protein n=1 Tax=Histidinibacterium lentulum TaxID=2480588 RepID=A0A3N2R6B1_9RHOB|nr:ROK family protein [Histidinibacterium lentulum]ROU03032.1 ROK family protein [Histidinibacterium lentulum]